MYKILFRPLLFTLSAEHIHKLLVGVIRFLFLIPGVRKLFRKIFTYNAPVLKTTMAGLTFNNKVGLAAGFDKNAEFFNDFIGFGFSFIEIGTVTPRPQPGNQKPRLFRIVSDNALINRMGFNNKGAGYANHRIMKIKGEKDYIIGGNIGKNTNTLNENAAQDYLFCFQTLYDNVDYFAVNVSCPNVADLNELQNISSLRGILEGIIRYRRMRPVFKPVFLKISPDLSFQQIDEIIDLCVEMGIDGIVATNTTSKRYNLTVSEEFTAQIGKGGLSGKPLRDRSTEIIRYISQRTGGKMPVIGVGGIMTPEDAIEKIEAGASIVQIYTGFIYEGPFLAKNINKALEKHLLKHT
jgi:dihydroorotate dehydrogenase